MQQAKAKQRNWLRAWRMPRRRWICSLPGRRALHRPKMPDPRCCCLQLDWVDAEKAHLEDLFSTYDTRKR